MYGGSVMSSPEYMMEETKKTASIYMDYVQKKGKIPIFAFYEGSDDQFYYELRFIQYLRDREIEIENYDCNGKKNVLYLQNKIAKSSNKSKSKILFFVDKDYDSNSDISAEVFITPTYSIENLYFTDNALRQFLKKKMKVSSEDVESCNDVQVALSLLREKRQELVNDILFGNACFSLQRKKLACLRDAEEEAGFQNIKTYKKIVSIKDIEAFNNEMVNKYIFTQEEIVEEIRYLETSPERLIRGKYFLERMPKYIEEIITLIRLNKDGKFSKKRKISYNTNPKTLLSDFSGFAETPRELIEYLDLKFKDEII